MATENSVVIELQSLATSKDTDVADLLRKALVVATKLDLTEFRDWVNNELHGYDGDAKAVPSYRRQWAQLKVQNPYRGLQPFLINDTRIMETICDREIRDPVGSLMDLLNRASDKTDYLVIPMPDGVTAKLMQWQGQFPMVPVLTLACNQVAAILDAVRSTVLEWALRLEKEGILGDGLRFTDAEKRRAGKAMDIKIENFQGIIGDVQQSTVTQNLNMTVQKGDFESLRQFLKSEGVEDGEIKELKKAIEEDGAKLEGGNFGERVGAWIGRMVGKAATGASQIGVHAAGHLLAMAIGKYYGL